MVGDAAGGAFVLSWEFSPFALPLPLCALLMIALARFAWGRRAVPGSTPLIVITAAGAVWAVAYALELSAPDLATKVAWVKVEYLGIVAIPPAWLAFGLAWTGRGAWLTRQRLAFLLVEPVLVLVLVWTSPAHTLFWEDIRLDRTGPYAATAFRYGPLFWVHAAFGYGCLAAGALVIVRQMRRSPPLFRSQAGALLVAVAAPWLGNLLYLTGLTPAPHLDLTPYTVALSGLALGWAIYRRQFLDAVLGLPLVADATAVEGMHDGVVVVDSRGRIVSANSATAPLLGLGPRDVVGRAAAAVFPDWPRWAEHLRDRATARAELQWTRDRAVVDLDVLATPRGTSGAVIVLRDATERKRAEAAEVVRRVEAARLEGVLLTVRETADRLGNALNGADGLTQVVLQMEGLPPDARSLLEQGRVALRAATTYVRDLQKVAQVATKETPFGPALDLERSILPPAGPAESPTSPSPS